MWFAGTMYGICKEKHMPMLESLRSINKVLGQTHGAKLV